MGVPLGRSEPAAPTGAGRAPAAVQPAARGCVTSEGPGVEVEVYALIWLLPVTLMLGAGGVLLFLWCVRSGQFEDLEGAAWRILQEDEPPRRASGRKPGDRQG